MTTGRCQVRVGRLVAGHIERELRKGAHQADVSIVVDRQVGWFNGYLLVTVKGEGDNVRRFLAAAAKWINHKEFVNG